MGERRHWRYQPIWIDEGEEQVFGLCECWFTEDDRLSAWAEGPFTHPQGADLEELTRDIARMLTDAFCWKAVAYAELKVGMAFEHAVDQRQREALAKMIEATAHNFKAVSDA